MQKFEKGRLGKGAKVKLATQICNTLKIHAQIEEEILYPAAREFLIDLKMLGAQLAEGKEQLQKKL